MQNQGTELSQMKVMLDVSSTKFEDQKMRPKFECGRRVQISCARKCTHNLNAEICAHISSATGCKNRAPEMCTNIEAEKIFCKEQEDQVHAGYIVTKTSKIEY